ncbi:MAG: NAD(P)/FAD-dependent oxidoreductase [Gammaproteobacteria bacterium]|nr:NAD(P)/FAD-dependent oxidoreductase [Gammaproteobacteria bacterium]
MGHPEKSSQDSALTRRTLIRGCGAASIAAATPRLVRAQNRSDVLVIGAGLSGRGAALLLQEAGINVQVIEARNRIGGRVESLRNIPGNPEAGGTAFGPGYARLVDAANTHGTELIDITPITPFFFDRQLILDNEFISGQDWPTHALNPFPESAKNFMPWMYLPVLLGSNNPLKTSDAWLAPGHADLDVSLHEYLRNMGQTDETIQIAYNTNPAWGNSAHDVSTLMVLSAYFFSDMQRQLAAGGKIMGYTARGGNQAIPEAMAGALKNEVRLNQQVTGIRSTSGGTEVYCANGTVYRADRVICSVPCSVLKRIRIDPMLRGAQALAVNTLESQLINQVHMIAKKPFWEIDGLTPNMFTNSLCGMVVAEHKGNSPADITSLTAWVRGNNAAWMDQIDQQDAIAAVVADIERLRPAAKGQLEVAAYKSWYRDPFASGDWAVWQPGQITKFAHQIAASHERIHFCGEHTAVSNRGMEGALESGERVALEVLNTI